MSNNFVKDMNELYEKYDFHSSVKNMDKEQLKTFLIFRTSLLAEEMTELAESIETNDKEEIVDALIDILVVTLGTLDLFEIDVEKAWNEVLRANSEKEVGIKESRPNPFGMPDLVKPLGWKGPEHQGNHGIL